MFKHKKEYRKLIKQTNGNVSNLEKQISNLRKNNRNSQIYQQDIIKFDTSIHHKQYDNFNQYSDNKIDSLIDSIYNEEIEKISQYYDTETLAQVNNYPNTKLIKSYNINSRLLAQKGTKVAINKSSLKQDRLGSNQAAILNENNKGDYFVIRENGFEYLFPGEKLKVNQHNLATVEKLFVCTGYESSPSGKFKLIKAAIISRSSKAELVLQQRGELHFL